MSFIRYPFIYPLLEIFIISIFCVRSDGIDENMIIISALVVTALALLLSLIVCFIFKILINFPSLSEQDMFDRYFYYMGLDGASVYFIFFTSIFTLGEYLINAFLNSSVPMTGALYVVVIIVLLKIIGFLCFASFYYLDLSLVILFLLPPISIFIFYVCITYGIGHPRILFKIIGLLWSATFSFGLFFGPFILMLKNKWIDSNED